MSDRSYPPQKSAGRRGRNWAVSVQATQVPSADDLSYILNDIALKQELELLPIHQSYILKQFYCEHKSMEEISIPLGMSQRTVRYHRQAGLKSLRIRLQVKSE